MRLAIAILLFAGLVFAADDEVCCVCGKKIEGKFYRMTDRYTEAQVAVCPECEQLESRCFACGLPVKPDAKQLPDGRYLCARDAREAILSDEETKSICEDLKDDLNRQYSRFMTFPTANVTVSVVDQFNLQSLFKSPGFEQACSSVFGATSTHRLPNDKFAHSVNLLSGLRKPRIRAVCAHEYTHAWMGENVSLERRQAMAPEAIEAFCELVAYRLTEADHDAVEQRVIKANGYTRGQLDAFLAAENRHGFNAILDWVKSGEDTKLDPDDLDRVKAVRGKESRPKPALVLISAAAPRSGPDKLMLKGVSGTPNRRFALINDKTFMAAETASVRVGESNVLIRCLEIRANSAVIQVEGSAEKRELKLDAR